MPSIYRPKHSVTNPEVDVVSGTARVHVDSRSSRRETDDGQTEWAGRRKAQPATMILPATRTWMNSLPLDYRPQALGIRFPRILNLIAASWDNPKDCSAFISSLLHDQRGGRKGFPPEVVADIHDLRVYYAKLHPIIDWDESFDNKRGH